jgi:hypothetical protein
MASIAPAEFEHFKKTFLYEEGAFFVDEVVRLDAEAKEASARFDTTRPLPLSDQALT